MTPRDIFFGKVGAAYIAIATAAVSCVLAYLLFIGAVKPTLRNGIFFVLLAMITIGSTMLLMAAYYTKQLHKKFPDPYSRWETFSMFFTTVWAETPENEFGRQLALKLTFFRINYGALFAMFFFAFIILIFSGWFVGLKQ